MHFQALAPLFESMQALPIDDLYKYLQDICEPNLFQCTKTLLMSA